MERGRFVDGLRLAGGVDNRKVPGRYGLRFRIPGRRNVRLRAMENDDGGRLAVEGLHLRVVAGDMPDQSSIGTGGAVEQYRNVGDPDGGAGGYEVDEGKVVHEVVQELAVLNPLDSGDIDGFGARLLIFSSGGGEGEPSEEVAAFHLYTLLHSLHLRRFPMLSIVIPIHNEEPAILPLYDRLCTVLEKLSKPYEIIFVDDASTDRSFDLLANLVETDAHLKVLRLRRNFGQTAALAAGFDEAQGEVIVSLDGDLQHDPEDIPLLLEKIDEGFDIASGWRKNRVDNAVTRKLPSKIANWMMKRASGVDIHDFGTTFKAYRAEVLKEVNLYGELHRFIPALASFYGARVVEVPIKNIERPNGESHYGLSRTFRVFFDIITINFLLRYLTRPMHFFGKWGLGGIVLGSLVLAVLLVEKIMGMDIIAEHGPLLVAAAMLWFAGLMLFCVGLIGEVLMRTYFESQGRRIYAVREIRCRREQVVDGAR